MGNSCACIKNSDHQIVDRGSKSGIRNKMKKGDEILSV